MVPGFLRLQGPYLNLSFLFYISPFCGVMYVHSGEYVVVFDCVCILNVFPNLIFVNFIEDTLHAIKSTH